MVEVLLIIPPLSFEGTYPLSMASLAAALKRQGHSPQGLDLRLAPQNKKDSNAIWRQLKASPPDLVVIETSIRNVGEVLKLIAELKERIDCRIALTGSAATLDPDLFFSRGQVDAVVIGDPETAIPLWLESGYSDNLPGSAGLLLASEGKVPIEAPDFPPLSNMPAMARDVFPQESYCSHIFRKGKRHAAIECSRGCPHNCTFCPSPRRFFGTYRYREVEDIIEEMESLRSDHGITSFWIEDEQPVADRESLVKLCSALRRRLPGVELEFPNGIWPDLLDLDLIDELAAAGCRRIALGIESGVQSIRQSLERPVDEDRMRSLIAHCRKKDILTTGYFMIGLPAEGIGQMATTLRAAGSLALDYAHFSVYWPLLPLLGDYSESRRRLLLIRALAYLGVYASPGRVRHLIKAEEISLRELPTAMLRLLDWIAAGEKGGGGW